jgi:hypothetical protein
MKEKMIIIGLVLMAGVVILLLATGNSWALMPLLLAYLVVFFTVSVIRAKIATKRGQKIDGLNICHHHYELIKSSVSTYGISDGVRKVTTDTYKCAKCGHINDKTTWVSY